MPELGKLNRKQIAALVGVAPLNPLRERHPARPTHHLGWPPRVRAALWMGTLVAVQRNPAIRAFYQRLVAGTGLLRKVALTAAMHKLLLVLNALLRQRVPWHDSAQPV